MNIPKIKDLRQICQGGAKGEREKVYYVNRFFTRKISIFITKFFLILGMSANQVTLLSTLAALAGFVLFVVPGKTYLIIASALMILWTILDCNDGEVARFRGPSPAGQFIDSLNADLLYGFMMFFGGIGVFVNYGIMNFSGFLGYLQTIPPIVFVIAGGVGGISKLLARAYITKFHGLMRDYYTSKGKKKPLLRNRVSWDFKIEMLFFNQAGLLHHFMLLAVIFNVLHVYMLFYGLAFSAMLLVTVIVIIRRLWKKGLLESKR